METTTRYACIQDGWGDWALKTLLILGLTVTARETGIATLIGSYIPVAKAEISPDPAPAKGEKDPDVENTATDADLPPELMQQLRPYLKPYEWSKPKK